MAPSLCVLLVLHFRRKTTPTGSPSISTPGYESPCPDLTIHAFRSCLESGNNGSTSKQAAFTFTKHPQLPHLTMTALCSCLESGCGRSTSKQAAFNIKNGGTLESKPGFCKCKRSRLFVCCMSSDETEQGQSRCRSKQAFIVLIYH